MGGPGRKARMMSNDNDWYTTGPGGNDPSGRSSDERDGMDDWGSSGWSDGWTDSADDEPSTSRHGPGIHGPYGTTSVDDYSIGTSGDGTDYTDGGVSTRGGGTRRSSTVPETPVVDRGVLGLLKGRTFLYLLAILAAFALVTVIASAVRGNAEQRDADTRANILATLPVSSESDMKRQTDTMLGKILAQGKVTIPADSCVNFVETSGCHAQVSRQEERYQSHQESYECGTKDKKKTCYRTVWEWDEVGSPDTLTAKNAVILGETVDYSTVSIPSTSQRPENLGIMGSTSYGYYYPRGKGNHSGNIRYSYRSVPGEYSGVAFLDTAKGRGHITKFHDFVEGGTANDQREKAKKPSHAPAIVFWIFEVLAFGGSVTGGYFIVRNDIDDGQDSGF